MHIAQSDEETEETRVWARPVHPVPTSLSFLVCKKQAGGRKEHGAPGVQQMLDHRIKFHGLILLKTQDSRSFVHAQNWSYRVPGPMKPPVQETQPAQGPQPAQQVLAVTATRLIVKNLAPTVDERRLRDHFDGLGEVRAARFSHSSCFPSIH